MVQRLGSSRRAVEQETDRADFVEELAAVVALFAHFEEETLIHLGEGERESEGFGFLGFVGLALIKDAE
jgi:hypothetical protein